MGFVMDKVALGQVFSEYFGFPCQLSFHRLFHITRNHHVLSGAGTIGQTVADVPSGLSLIPPQETKKTNKQTNKQTNETISNEQEVGIESKRRMKFMWIQLQKERRELDKRNTKTIYKTRKQ
jgi:hypothetical protein